ncbi:MAG: GyrI-like domain-containing protein [Propionicimonas sp.]
MSVNPKLDTLPAWVSAGVRQVVPMAQLPAVFGRVFEQVAGAVAAAGGEVTGPAYAHYFGMPTETVDVEIGFGMARAIELPGLVVTENPPLRVALGTHVGPYAELPRAYGELMGWLAQQQVAITDSMYEFYDSEPDVPAEATITRMAFPLAAG